MISAKPPLRLLPWVLWPGLALMVVGALLFNAQWHIDWEPIRGEWNERGMLVYLAQHAWVPFLVLGGALVLGERLWAWPLFRWLAPVIALAAYLVLFPPFGGHPEPRWSICLNNQRQIAWAALAYAQDHAMTYPTSWEDLHLPPEVLKCHGGGKPGDRWGGFGLNAYLLGQPSGQVTQPEKVLVTADSVIPTSLLSSPADIAKRHHGKYIASFADGHIEVLGEDVPLERGLSRSGREAERGAGQP